MTNHEKIIALNKIWYDLIGGEHHKDRDCHFRIDTLYSYGDRVEYSVEHHGYINHDYETTEWSSLKEAEEELIRVLKLMILQEIDTYLQHYGDLDWDQHNRYGKEDLEEIQTRVLLLLKDKGI